VRSVVTGRPPARAGSGSHLAFVR